MTKLLRILVLTTFGLVALSGCNQQGEADKKAVQATAPETIAAPTDAKDTAAWKKYLVATVKQNMQGVTSSPYMYFIPSGDDDDTKAARKNQLDNVQVIVARTVLPGNMMAFGGPDSKTSADFIAEAFKEAKAGAFKGVVVLFIGAAADSERAKSAITVSGADFRFVEMK